MVGVAGLEPAASWSRILARKFSQQFRAHSVLFVPGVDAFQTSPLPCFRPLPAWYGSAFGSDSNSHPPDNLQKLAGIIRFGQQDRLDGVTDEAGQLA